MSPKVLGGLYRKHLSEPRQERLFLGNVGFFTAFGTVRVITHAIRAERGPFRDVTPGGHHIHHLTFGILGPLGTGFAWNDQLGRGTPAPTTGPAAGYGIPAALTLDEFALWPNLEDGYWKKQGREPIVAVAIFGSLLALATATRDLVRDATLIASGRRDARDLL